MFTGLADIYVERLHEYQQTEQEKSWMDGFTVQKIEVEFKGLELMTL